MKRSAWLIVAPALLAASAAARAGDPRDEIVWFCDRTEAIVHGGPLYEPAAPCPERWSRNTLGRAQQEILWHRELEASRAREERRQRDRKEAEANAAAAAGRRAEDARAAEEKRQREFAAQRAAEERQAKIREERRRTLVAAQTEEDARNGYKRSTIDDFILDYREMPSGTKLVVSGLHYSLGQIETLSKGPQSTQVIYLDTSGLSRDTRKLILACHDRSAYCRMTVWARSGCAMSSFGHLTNAPCLIVEGIRGGSYEHPADTAVRK